MPTIVDGSTGVDTSTYKKEGFDSLQTLQVVRTDDGGVATGTTTIPLDDTIPQNTEGTEFITVTITPKSASSILEITASVMVSPSNINWIIAALFKDSDASAIAAVYGYQTAATGGEFYSLKVRLASGGTSAITFKIRAGSPTASTVTFNGTSGNPKFSGVSNSFIEVREIL